MQVIMIAGSPEKVRSRYCQSRWGLNAPCPTYSAPRFALVMRTIDRTQGGGNIGHSLHNIFISNSL